ncbi:hypothetical protein V2J09_003711 [Rumex salicifolius]
MSSNSRQATAAHDLKQRVLTCLDRLGDRDTLAQATAELDLIARSLSPETSLSAFLSCLLSVDSSHRAAVRAHSLRLIASLAASHPLHLAPHLPKILSSSLLRRIRDPDSSVRSACSAASSSLARHVSSSPFRLILDPLLAALLVEQDINVQIGSAVCLSAAIESSEIVESGELRRVLPKMVKLAKSDGFRAKPALLGLIGSVVAADGGGVVNGPGLMGNVVSCATENLSSEDWAARKAAAEALEKVAVAVAQRELVAEVQRLCVNALENRRFDKVKIAREAMNRALEAWKEVNKSSEDSPSKDTNDGICSPPLSRDHRQFSIETHQSKKKLIKSRSSLSDCSTVTGSSTVSKSLSYVGSETPQLKKTLFKSRSSMSSLSDDSSSTVAKKTSPQIRSDRSSSSRPARKSDARKLSDWRVDIRVPQAPDSPSSIHAEVGFEHKNSEVQHSGEYDSSDTRSSTKGEFIKRMYEEQVHKSSTKRFGSRVVPLQDVDYSDVVEVNCKIAEEIDDNTAEIEDLSQITKQLIQIEKQQSNLMELLQTFMGASQSGINSLETRVSGLEKALGGISHDLAMQNGRMPNESAGNSCCMIPGAEFLSPKFWRRNEGGRFVASKPCYSGSMHSVPHKDINFVTGEMESVPHPDLTRNLIRNFEVSSPTRIMGKTLYEVSHRRACNGGSLDGASPSTCSTPVVQR